VAREDQPLPPQGMGSERESAQFWVQQPWGTRVGQTTKNCGEIKSPEVMLNLFASASSSL
jgi:hypothetical protein